MCIRIVWGRTQSILFKLDDTFRLTLLATCLHSADAATHEAGEERRVGASQMQLGFDAAPHGLVVGGVPPGRAHLRGAALVADVQVAEDERQDLRVEARHVRLVGPAVQVRLVQVARPADGVQRRQLRQHQVAVVVHGYGSTRPGAGPLWLRIFLARPPLAHCLLRHPSRRGATVAAPPPRGAPLVRGVTWRPRPRYWFGPPAAAAFLSFLEQVKRHPLR